MTAPSPAGSERETVEALAEVLHGTAQHSPPKAARVPWSEVHRFTKTLWRRQARAILASPWLAAYVAAAVETARREGAETALRGAAREASSGPGWGPQQLTVRMFDLAEVSRWLRGRADALRAATEGER